MLVFWDESQSHLRTDHFRLALATLGSMREFALQAGTRPWSDVGVLSDNPVDRRECFQEIGRETDFMNEVWADDRYHAVYWQLLFWTDYQCYLQPAKHSEQHSHQENQGTSKSRFWLARIFTFG